MSKESSSQTEQLSVYEPKQNQGRGLVDRKLIEAPSHFIASRPKAALLLWLLGGFGWDVRLRFAIRVRYKNRNR